MAPQRRWTKSSYRRKNWTSSYRKRTVRKGPTPRLTKPKYKAFRSCVSKGKSPVACTRGVLSDQFILRRIPGQMNTYSKLPKAGYGMYYDKANRLRTMKFPKNATPTGNTLPSSWDNIKMQEFMTPKGEIYKPIYLKTGAAAAAGAGPMNVNQ